MAKIQIGWEMGMVKNTWFYDSASVVLNWKILLCFPCQGWCFGSLLCSCWGCAFSGATCGAVHCPTGTPHCDTPPLLLPSCSQDVLLNLQLLKPSRAEDETHYTREGGKWYVAKACLILSALSRASRSVAGPALFAKFTVVRAAEVPQGQTWWKEPQTPLTDGSTSLQQSSPTHAVLLSWCLVFRDLRGCMKFNK